jgi:hypothetical protein
MSGISAPPTVSSNPLYPLEQVTSFETNTIPANVVDYGDLILPPSGYIASSHLVPTSGGLEIEGHPDPISGSVGGVTGAGFNLSDTVPSSGGFDVCFSMSAGNWQNVHLVLSSWPADSNWSEGENDFFEGNPGDMEINVHQIGNDPTDSVWSGNWPSALGTGAHVISARWDPVNGYRYYLDGQLVATAPISASVRTPTTPHKLAIQMQDMTQSSTSSESATIYWTARYGYAP